MFLGVSVSAEVYHGHAGFVIAVVILVTSAVQFLSHVFHFANTEKEEMRERR